MNTPYIDIHTHNTGLSDGTISVHQFDLHNIHEKQLPDGYFSVGLHPWDISNEGLDDALACVETLLHKPKCIAVGEIGCDKTCNIPLILQKQVFREQLKFAKEAQVPVIIHNVRCTNEILFELKHTRVEVPFIFHGFVGHPQTAVQIVRAGGLLSFGNALMWHSNTILAFRAVPPQHVFFETDNKPTLDIETVYKQATQLSGIQVRQWKKTCLTNFKNIIMKT